LNFYNKENRNKAFQKKITI